MLGKQTPIFILKYCAFLPLLESLTTVKGRKKPDKKSYQP